MTKGYTKVKGENENMYMANKKLWVQVKDTKIGYFFAPNVEKGKLSKESLIVGKHKRLRLRQKLVTGKTSIL